MKRSEQVNEIAGALAKAQGAMASAKKDANNPHFKSKYADLASIVDAIKAPLAQNGIAYVQSAIPSDKQEVRIETTLMHASGQWVQSDGLTVPVQKADAQGYGSALTYARRYDLAAICGVAPDDDDGNAAAKAQPTAAQQEQDAAREQPRMLPEDVADLMDMLDRATDVDELRTRTKFALAQAKAVGDQEAFAQLRAHSVKVAKMLEEAATA